MRCHLYLGITYFVAPREFYSVGKGPKSGPWRTPEHSIWTKILKQSSVLELLPSGYCMPWNSNFSWHEKCQQVNPVICLVGQVLEFLQEYLSVGLVLGWFCLPWTYICHYFHYPYSPGWSLVSRFLWGARQLRSVLRSWAPSWDL